MILGKKYKIGGTYVIDRGCYKHHVFKDHDIISIVSMFLYFMKDVEWIRDIALYGWHDQFYIICYVKEMIEVLPLRRAMRLNILQVQKQLKETGINTDYVSQDAPGVTLDASLVHDDTTIRFWLKGG